MGNRGIAPLIPNLGLGREWSTSRPLPPEITPAATEYDAVGASQTVWTFWGR